MAKRKFEAEGLEINFVGVSRYLGAYLGTREQLETWLKPQVVPTLRRMILEVVNCEFSFSQLSYVLYKCGSSKRKRIIL